MVASEGVVGLQRTHVLLFSALRGGDEDAKPRKESHLRVYELVGLPRVQQATTIDERNDSRQ